MYSAVLLIDLQLNHTFVWEEDQIKNPSKIKSLLPVILKSKQANTTFDSEDSFSKQPNNSTTSYKFLFMSVSAQLS